MKKIILRILGILMLFCAVIAGAFAYRYYQNREVANYESMAKASLPTISLIYGENEKHTLFGYKDEMTYSTMRGLITPLTDKRKVTVELGYIDEMPDQIIYQLRSLNGERLIEDGVLDKWTNEGGNYSQELQLANLMESGIEYTLSFLLKYGEETVHYYSRVIYFEDGHTTELINFIHEFAGATFGENTEFIINYIQPNDSMGMDDLSYINIHSRYKMFTWLDLSPVITGEVETNITELSSTQMTASHKYPVSVTYGDESRQYQVEEIFTVRWRNDTLYLLDYDRYMTQDFSYYDMTIDRGDIAVGITAKECRTMPSENGKIIAYSYQDQLWTYDAGNNAMNLIFTYLDGEDERSARDGYTVEPIRVSDNGDVDYIVYGYHNRGEHEGHVGISFYRYQRENRQIEELFYIPSVQSEDRMQEQMGGLAYVSDTNLLYFLYDNTIYSIDLESKEKMELARGSEADSFFYNAQGSIAAWGSGEEIVVMNLEDGSILRIHAEDGEFLKIQGFIGNDIIYGVGKDADSGLLLDGTMINPFYKLEFLAIGEEEAEGGSYENAGIYILNTTISDNEIDIQCLSKTANGYELTKVDQVFLNERTNTGTSQSMKSRQNEGFLKECYIILNAGDSEPALNTEQNEYLAGNRANVLESVESEIQKEYFAYGKGQLLGSYTRLSSAIQAAYDSMGRVVDTEQNTVWSRESRDLYKTLAVPSRAVDSESESLIAALNILCRFEGAAAQPQESEYAFDEAGSMQDIMKNSIDTLQTYLDEKVLDLSGCSVVQILYYINQGHPVVALTGENSAVLIIGYETGKITIYQPYGDITMQMTMEEAQSYFEGFGSYFLGL